jgi:hypothetical protein
MSRDLPRSGKHAGYPPVPAWCINCEVKQADLPASARPTSVVCDRKGHKYDDSPGWFGSLLALLGRDESPPRRFNACVRCGFDKSLDSNTPRSS